MIFFLIKSLPAFENSVFFHQCAHEDFIIVPCQVRTLPDKQMIIEKKHVGIYMCWACIHVVS